MPKLFSNNHKKFLSIIDKPEKELNRFICENWNNLFPKLTFITNEFLLKGNVRSFGNNGRIDILAYNSESKKFVVFELKKDYDKNITDQAADYRDYIQDNFSDVYLHSIQKYEVQLPKFSEINQTNIEIILIAKKFSLTQIDRVKKFKENIVTLIKYYWFEDELVFIDYINNDPDDVKIENINAKKISDISKIITQDPEQYEIDRFFSLKTLSKDAFYIFFNSIKTKGNVYLEFQQTKIKVKINNETFSIIGFGGKTGRKSILQINTNIDISVLKNLLFDDRYRGEEKKMKGSLGTERYEVFIRNNEEAEIFSDFLMDKL
jgi:hypothetical protein